MRKYKVMRKSRELKALAREKIAKNKKALLGAFLLVCLIIFTFVVAATIVIVANMEKDGVIGSPEEMTKYFNRLFFNDDSISSLLISYAGSIFIGALMQTLSVGFTNVCYKAATDKKVKATDLFEVYRMNPDKIILIYLVSSLIQFIIALPSNVITLYIDYTSANDMKLLAVNGFVSLITLFIQIVVKVLLAFSFFAYIEDKERSVKDDLMYSVILMQRCAFRYLYVFLSFIGWFVVVIFTYGLATLYVGPYLQITLILLYINVVEENNKRMDIA